MKKLNWGIISTGVIANNFAKTAQKMQDEMTIYAVASRNIENAKAFANNYNIEKYYSSYVELAQDTEIDVIYIATPHNFHYENMILCLNNSKHIVCEKSFTVNSKEAKEIYKLAKEKNLFVMEGFWTKFLPIYRDLEKILNEGTIGEINIVTAQYGFTSKQDRLIRKFDPELAGGALLDIGVYNIGFAAMILGYSPKKILSTVKLNAVGTDEYSTIILEYDNGKMAQLTTAIGTVMPVIGCIYGTLGSIIIKDFKAPQSIEVILNDSTSYTVERFFDINGYEYEIREANNCIKEGKQFSEIFTPQESIAVMNIMDKVRDIWGMKYPDEQ